MRATHAGRDLTSFAARARVPVGFLAAALFVCLARPTVLSLVLGFPVAAAGEALRI